MIAGIILLDVSNQHVIYGPPPQARARLNTIFMGATFLGAMFLGGGEGGRLIRWLLRAPMSGGNHNGLAPSCWPAV